MPSPDPRPARKSSKDRVEQAIACGINPHTLGLSRELVNRIVHEQAMAVWVEEGGPCPNPCDCGMHCIKIGFAHWAHRCKRHRDNGLNRRRTA